MVPCNSIGSFQAVQLQHLQPVVQATSLGQAKLHTHAFQGVLSLCCSSVCLWPCAVWPAGCHAAELWQHLSRCGQGPQQERSHAGPGQQAGEQPGRECRERGLQAPVGQVFMHMNHCRAGACFACQMCSCGDCPASQSALTACPAIEHGAVALPVNKVGAAAAAVVQVLSQLSSAGIAVRIATKKLAAEEAPESYKDVSQVCACLEGGGALLDSLSSMLSMQVVFRVLVPLSFALFCSWCLG